MSICRWITRVLLLAAIFPFLARAASVEDLLHEAGRPETFHGAPEKRDSLISLLVSSGQPDSLILLLDTPWSPHLEVLRLALIGMGEPAGQEIAQRLEQGSDPETLVSRMLVVFEHTGGPEHVALLEPYLDPGTPATAVPAARCLASFGGWDYGIRMLLPLLGSTSPHARLCAAWALGEIGRKDQVRQVLEELKAAIERLMDDPEPRVRLQAAETMHLLLQSADVPEPLSRH